MTLSFPALTSIGESAFYASLHQFYKNVSQSKAVIDFTSMANLETIGNSAFTGTGFNFGTTLDLTHTKLTSIGSYCFT